MANDYDPVDAYLDIKHNILCEINRGDNRKYEQRPGQWTFNRLDSRFPEITEILRGTTMDCFHQDDKIVEFWNMADTLFWNNL